jgi:hypothetical protein
MRSFEIVAACFPASATWSRVPRSMREPTTPTRCRRYTRTNRTPRAARTGSTSRGAGRRGGTRVSFREASGEPAGIGVRALVEFSGPLRMRSTRMR